jgi:hypothetical protein
MRKHGLIGIAVCALAGLSGVAAGASQTYTGNGGMGFGGPIGTGSLTVNDAGGGILNFSLSTGVPFSGNSLVLYLDTKPGGVNDTSTLNDTADGGRTAISGANNSSNPPTRTLATFPTGFGADYALSVEPGVFGGLFNLSTPANFGFVASANLAGSGSGPFTFSVNRSDIGLGATDAFSFVGTLISTSAFRSNETIGPSVTTPGTAGDAPNAGFNGTQVFSTANTFAVPEPSAVAVGALGAVGLLSRRRS